MAKEIDMAIDLPEELPTEEVIAEEVPATPNFAETKISAKKLPGKINIRELQLEIEKLNPAAVVQGKADESGALVELLVSAPLGSDMTIFSAEVLKHNPRKTDREESEEDNLSLEQRVKLLEDEVFKKQ